MPDVELIRRFRGGDAAAFGRLAARWDEKAYALAYRLTHDRDASHDIKQAAFIRAHQGLARFSGQAAFSTWLYRVVVNLCRDRQRSERVRDAATRRSVASGQQRPVPSLPAAALERSETGRRVAAAVDSLPASIREVVVMRHYQELRFAEIAEIVGSPASTVKSRMARGLRMLRDQLQEMQP